MLSSKDRARVSIAARASSAFWAAALRKVGRGPQRLPDERSEADIAPTVRSLRGVLRGEKDDIEEWDIHKVVPLVNVNLSELVFIKWLGMGLPRQWFIREAPGILLIAFYLLVPPAVLAKTFMKERYTKHGIIRYSIMVMLMLLMLSLPIKMYLRWALNLKYIVAIPEFFFNI